MATASKILFPVQKSRQLARVLCVPVDCNFSRKIVKVEVIGDFVSSGVGYWFYLSVVEWYGWMEILG